MKRRALLAAGAASAALVATRSVAQQTARGFRVGVLSPFTGLAAGPYLSVLRDHMAKHGFVEGRNLTLDVRSADVGSRSAADAAGEIVALKPDAMIAFSTQPAAGALTASATVPIIFAWVADPVRTGLVKDLAKPGGNVTGVTNRYFELGVKRVELLRELLPSAKRVAAIAGYFDPLLESVGMPLVQSAADRAGFELVRIQAGGVWESVVPAAVQARVQAALVMTPFAVFGLLTTAGHVARSAMERRLPTVFSDLESVDLGGLMAYATNLSEDVRRAADLLARVLKGEKPAALPVDQASRFELGINLRTARAIGLAVPRSLLVRADRVIE